MNRGCRSWMVVMVITLSSASPALGQERKTEEELEKSRWSNVGDVGIVAINGNTTSLTLQFENKLRYRTEKAEWELWFGGLRIKPAQGPFAVGDADDFAVVDAPSFVAAERYYISSHYQKRIAEHFFAVGGGGWDKDRNAGIENRVTLYAGVGNIWLGRPEHNLRTDYAVAFTYRKEYIPDPQKDERFAEARFSSEYSIEFGKNAAFDSDFVFHTRIGDINDYRFTISNAVTASLTDVFALRGGLVLIYHHQPALEEVELFEIPPDQGGVAGGTVFIRRKKLDSVVKLSVVINF